MSYSGPINIIDPATFEAVTDPTGKSFFLVDAKKISFAALVAALGIDGSETVVEGVQGKINVTGSGTTADPYILDLAFGAPDGSETKVQGTASQIEVNGSGTTADPYTISLHPSFGSPIKIYNSLGDFPAGDTGVIYIAADTEKIYRWDANGQGAYKELSPSTSSGGGGGRSSVNLSGDGATAIVGYEGTAAPTIGGSQGNMIINEPADCRIVSVFIDAPTGSGATSGNNFALTIASSNGRNHFGADRVIERSSGIVIGTSNEYNIAMSQVGVSAGQVQYSYNNIAGLGNGFKIAISPCG
ncbi:hypothetical protein [Lewinella sp. W8]|uniref:hypothetical protein n=1 Tax=Lewinella sp. W8 TaxID=2528208 RepID=UPI00106771FB|nr:hypothetical protein [Lewinella sp. W8]MTB53041.1 hypothetical protein [Lewinella sp. W8]